MHCLGGIGATSVHGVSPDLWQPLPPPSPRHVHDLSTDYVSFLVLVGTALWTVQYRRNHIIIILITVVVTLLLCHIIIITHGLLSTSFSSSFHFFFWILFYTTKTDVTSFVPLQMNHPLTHFKWTIHPLTHFKWTILSHTSNEPSILSHTSNEPSSHTLQMNHPLTHFKWTIHPLTHFKWTTLSHTSSAPKTFTFLLLQRYANFKRNATARKKHQTSKTGRQHQEQGKIITDANQRIPVGKH